MTGIFDFTIQQSKSPCRKDLYSIPFIIITSHYFSIVKNNFFSDSQPGILQHHNFRARREMIRPAVQCIVKINITFNNDKLRRSLCVVIV